MNQNKKLDAFIEDYFKEEDRQSPTSSTAIGIHDYDSELEDFSLSGLSEMKQSLRDFEKRFEGFDFDRLDDDHKVKYHLMNSRLKSAHRLFEKINPFERDPAFYAEFAIQSIFLLLLRNFAPLEKRLESAADRMEKIPDLLRAARENLKNPPQIYTKVAVEIMEGADALYSGLLPRIAEQAPQVMEKVLRARDTALKSMKEYESFLLKELAPRSGGEFAVGTELFDEILREEHLLDMDSEQLWETGRKELEKCENQLKEFVKREYNTDRHWKEVFDETKKNHPDAGNLLKAYSEYLERARKFVVKKDIIAIPENQKLVPMDTPEFSRPMTPTAAYTPPATYDEDRTGYLLVTPIDLNRPKNEQEAHLRDNSYGKIEYVSLHEAYPGHHLQLVYSSGITDTVYKRTFSLIFIEGWAFYCEQMMNEMGYFSREGRFCQLEAAYWRALRILLDVGLHTGRFDFDSAYEFMKKRVDWAPYVAMAELKRYTRMPTQALSYYTGKLELLKIKEKYTHKAGGDINLKQFHEELLGLGALPPKAVEWKLGLREIDPVTDAGMSAAGKR